MQKVSIYINGDVFLASSEISYLGPFAQSYREKLTKIWRALCDESCFDYNPKYSLKETLGQPILIRRWTMNGLPSDSKSIDNAILYSKTQRWSLMVDPEQQANIWIKKMSKIE